MPKVTPDRFNWICLALVPVVFSLPAGCAAPQPVAQIVNPASKNCLSRGGTLEIRRRGDGGEYGLCFFEDNRRCEEWALLRGDCPIGGRKVTGLLTAAARYCAAIGGRYTFTAPQTDSRPEQGTCALPGGKVCDVHAFYSGGC